MRLAVFHELDFGGAKRVVMEYAKRLGKNNLVDLYYVDSNKDNNLENYFSNAYWYKFNSKIWKGNNWRTRLNKDSIELIKLYLLHRKIASEIELKKYDYVFIHPSKFTQAPFLLRFLKTKCIYYCQEPLRIVYDPFKADMSNIKFPNNIYELLNRRIRKWIDRENFKHANIVLANSTFSKEFIERSYGKSASVCYLGVDIDLFKPSNLTKVTDVLFIGSKSDGYDLLNKLSKLFNNKLRVHAIFREENNPSITDKELVDAYNKSKVLLVINHNEPFGLIPLEAMACGIPVIAVREGGYCESVIDGKTGFLILRNYNELYHKINLIINNEKLRIEMGKNARENILQNWTWDKSVKRFIKIIKYEKYKD